MSTTSRNPFASGEIDDLDVRFRKLKFGIDSNDGRVVVFGARFKAVEVPGQPDLRVSVTMPWPGPGKRILELVALFSQWQAGVTLTPSLADIGLPDESPEDPDPEHNVIVETRIDRIDDIPQDFGVSVVVKVFGLGAAVFLATGVERLWALIWHVLMIQGRVGSRQTIVHKATVTRDGETIPQMATVTVSVNKGWFGPNPKSLRRIRSGKRPNGPDPNPYRFPHAVKYLYAQGRGGACQYDLKSNFGRGK
jgi:hypothetical protein